jgi:hypothetical protein
MVLVQLKKIKNEFLKNKIVYLILLILVILPFFWFPNNLYILGNDDTGLEYYNPLGALKNASSLFYSADGLPSVNQLMGYEFIYVLLLNLIRLVTFNKINLELLIYGIIIGGSFFYITKILELLNENKKSFGFYIAGLFYAMSSYFFFAEYIYIMPSMLLIFVAPIIVFYLLKSINLRSTMPLLKASIFTFIFSRCLVTPMAINFFIFLLPFIILWTYFKLGSKHVLYGIIQFLKLILFITLINAVIFVPLFFSIFTKNSALQDSISDRAKERYSMVENLKTEFGIAKVKGYLMNTYPKEIAVNEGHITRFFYKKYVDPTSFYVYLIVILSLFGVIGLVKEKNRTIIPVLLLYVISLLFVTIDVFPLLGHLYIKAMENFPIFTMNRYPSLKLSVPYVFFYSLLIGLGLNFLMKDLNKNKSRLFFLFLIIVLFISNYSSFFGLILTDNSGTVTTLRPMNFNEDYQKMIKEIHNYISDDSEFLLFPLGYGYGAFISGRDPSQVYRAQITGFKNLTGYNLIGNLQSLNSYFDPSLYVLAYKYYFEGDNESMFKLAKKINIKYVIFTKQKQLPITQFELMPQQTFASPNYYKIVDNKNLVYQNEGYVIYKIKSEDETSKFTTLNINTHLTFKKIADFFYIIKVKTQGSDKIIFHTRFSTNWNILQINKAKFNCQSPRNFSKNFPNILECLHTNDNIQGNIELIKSLDSRKTLLNNERYDKYLNSWNINTNNQNEYFIIILDSQKYLLLGFLFSLFILLTYSIILFKRVNQTLK